MYNVVDDALLDDSLRPYDWYKALVLAGAREHKLPEEYIQQIENVHVVQDSDGIATRKAVAYFNKGFCTIRSCEHPS